MERHSLKIEDITPTNYTPLQQTTSIESEVPGQQKLREASTAQQPVRAETSEQPNAHTIEWVDLRDMVRKPVYVGIQDMVITPQLIRAPKDTDEGPKTEDKNKQEEKPQTRIPVSKFRPAVKRLLDDRRESREADEERKKKETPEQPQRSSIPKLRNRGSVTRRKSTANDDQTVKSETTETKDGTRVKTKERKPVRRERMRKDHDEITKNVENERKSVYNDDNIDKTDDQTSVEVKQEEVEDEFDKLYDEIADDDAGSLPDDILGSKVKDPEKLDSTFEEIVHQYDEETVEQVRIEPVDKARYSKIPLLRRRSSHDVKVPKKHDRRLSLKTGITNKSVTVYDEKVNDSKDVDDDKNISSIEGDNSVESVENADNENDQTHSVEINNNDDDYILAQSPQPLPIYNTIASPESELVKVGVLTKELPLENSINQNMNLETPEPETVQVSAIDLPVNENNNDVQIIEEQITEIIKDPEYTSKVVESPNATVIDIPETNNDISIDTFDSEEQIKIEEKITTDMVIDRKETIKTATVKYDTILQSEESHINELQKDILIDKPQDELKSFSLLKNTNNVEERTKSRYIMKPVDKDKTNSSNAVTVEEEEIPIVKGKVSRILRRLTSHEHLTNADDDVNNRKEETDLKVEVENIPKKSVLSKIAMFERTELEPTPPKNQPHKYSKLKRTISEEIKHSPKIVQEVLKPNGTDDTDKHTVINVDTMKPVEVITNNEEQLTVTEILKEETIVFDNWDTAQLNKIEPIEIEPSESIVRNQNDTVLVDDRVHYIKAKEPEVVEQECTLPDEKKIESNYIKSDRNGQHKGYNKFKKLETKDFTEEGNGKGLATKNIPKNDYESPTLNTKPNNNRLYNNRDKVEKWKSTDALSEFLPVKEKINRLKSYEDTNIKKAKSTVELDIGDVVKGKVKKIIVRMNSFDMLDDVKQKEVVDVINVKERPRKRSVSEKIALFERKLTPVAMDDVGRSLNIDSKPMKNSINAIHTDINFNIKNSTATNANVTTFKNTSADVKVTTGNSNEVNVTTDNPTEVNLTTGNPTEVNVTTGNPTEINVTTGNTTDLKVTDYVAMIKELTNAKVTYGSVANMSYVELRDGRKMPVMALGTALLDPQLTKHIVSAAIDLGYRAIDTAFIYGNEREVGEGIRAKIQDGTVRREELFIMSKLWSTFHHPDLVEKACRASLAATGLEYFDLYMIHNPMSFKEGDNPLPKIANVIQYSTYEYLDAWFAMEALVAKGLVRSLGVSNFNAAQVGRVVEKGRVKPVVNQVECHPYLTQERLSEFCESRDVRLSCYGVLGSKGTPAELKNSQAVAIDDPLVQVMAAGLGITPAQLLIRYQIDSGRNVVVKASTAAHLRDNLRALGAALEPAQVAALSALNKNKRAFTFKGMGDTHKNYPFRVPF